MLGKGTGTIPAVMMPTLRTRRRYIVPMLIGLVLLWGAQACAPHSGLASEYPTTISRLRESGDYAFDPRTVLETLDRGEVDVFERMVATPEAGDLLPAGAFAWRQSDYLRITWALGRFHWKETWETWDVLSVTFRKECQEQSAGFDSFDITYYRPAELDSERAYAVRMVEIYPLASEASWGGGSHFARPLLWDWPSLDLASFSITADDALKIAEDHGGREARHEANNECAIMVMARGSNYGGKWSIYYYPGVHFEVIVDPFSGEFQRIVTN